jgi:hypothetical protein
MITKMRKQMPNPEMEMEQRFQLCTVTLIHHCFSTSDHTKPVPKNNHTLTLPTPKWPKPPSHASDSKLPAVRQQTHGVKHKCVEVNGALPGYRVRELKKHEPLHTRPHPAYCGDLHVPQKGGEAGVTAMSTSSSRLSSGCDLPFRVVQL